MSIKHFPAFNPFNFNERFIYSNANVVKRLQSLHKYYQFVNNLLRAKGKKIVPADYGRLGDGEGLSIKSSAGCYPVALIINKG